MFESKKFEKEMNSIIVRICFLFAYIGMYKEN